MTVGAYYDAPGDRANSCSACSGPPRWYLLRRSDAVATWACNQHLDLVLEDLQREWETTEVVVSPFSGNREAQ